MDVLNARRKNSAPRIIAGIHRGRRLTTPPGRETRPPLDSQRETVFNILGPEGVRDATTADLFCGSGSFGLEALSRGAREALFVDRDPAALQALQANIEALDFQEVSRVYRGDAFQFPAAPGDLTGPLNLVFMDPPFRALTPPGGVVKVHRHQAARAPALADRGVAVVRLPSGTALPDVSDLFEAVEMRALGRSSVYFFHM